jgi:hypothetical protein
MRGKSVGEIGEVKGAGIGNRESGIGVRESGIGARLRARVKFNEHAGGVARDTDSRFPIPDSRNEETPPNERRGFRGGGTKRFFEALANNETLTTPSAVLFRGMTSI